MGIPLPLRLKKGKFDSPKTLKKSIDEFLELLLTTPCYTFVPDPDFGFIFNNLRFEIFNEREGTIYNSQEKAGDDPTLYDKRISGTSKNINTFAIDLKEAVEKYETRLQDVQVVMGYNTATRDVMIDIKGIIKETLTKYSYTTTIKIWANS